MLIARDFSDTELLRCVEIWVDDLVQGDYQTAFSRTKHDPYYAWTPELIEAVINGYGLPEPHRSGEIFRVTPRAIAQGRRYFEVHRDGFFEIRYNLPLNHQWSDLTVTFEVELQPEGFVFILQEIHVF
jgi:hypothetical protein